MLKFLGIPYAEPPVGRCAGRRPSRTRPGWRRATRARSAAAARRGRARSGRRPTTSEDCLFLNVYTPHRKAVPEHDLRRKRPVMVWIHGGAFQVGESDDYDPTKLVNAGDVVVVTINYRLGTLRFLAHPALSAESPPASPATTASSTSSSRCAGCRTTSRPSAAIRKRVTIFGESAGGISVHASSPRRSRPAPSTAPSSRAAPSFTQPTLDAAETQGAAMADTLGCSGSDGRVSARA